MAGYPTRCRRCDRVLLPDERDGTCYPCEDDLQMCSDIGPDPDPNADAEAVGEAAYERSMGW